jgi:hypothetical protein
MYTLEEGTAMLREAVAECAAEHVFTSSMRRVRTAANSGVDHLLNLMPHLVHFQGSGMQQFVAEILDRFWSDGDHTRFGLMNAVTSLARDTRDPEDRWRLEELGGSIGARLRPPRPTITPARARQRVEFVRV